MNAISPLDTIKAHDAFSHSLGFFCSRWAALEVQLFIVVSHYAGVTQPIGRAIFAGMRARDLMSALDRIAVNTQMEESRHEHLKYIAAQIATLNTMRDRLVHNSNLGVVSSGTEGWQVTNAFKSQLPSAVYSHFITFKDIDLMRKDCERATGLLLQHSLGIPSPFKAPVEEDPALATWLYKSPQPESTQGKSKKAGQKRSARQ